MRYFVALICFAVLGIVAGPVFAGELEDCRVTVLPVEPKPPVPKKGTNIPKTGTQPVAKPRKWTPKKRVYHTIAKDEWEINCDPIEPTEPIYAIVPPAEYTPVPLDDPPWPTKPEPKPCDCFADTPPTSGEVYGWPPLPSNPALVVVSAPIYPPISPAPEPSTWLLMAAGAGLLAWRKRVR